MGSLRIVVSTAIVMVILCFSSASGQYAAEVDRYMLDPCVRVTAIYQDLDEQLGGMAQAVAVVKAMRPEALPAMVEAMDPMLRGKSSEQRKALYAIGLRQCLEGAFGTQDGAPGP